MSGNEIIDQEVASGDVIDAPVETQAEETEEIEVEIERAIPVIEKAGIVAFSKSGETILLTTTSADSKKWVLPKGHREEKDPDLLTCALRELTEETGFVAEPFSTVPVHKIIRVIQDPESSGPEDYAYEEITFFMGQIIGIAGDPERSVMIVEPSLAIRKLEYEDYALVVLKAVAARAAFMQAKISYVAAVRLGEKRGQKETVN